MESNYFWIPQIKLGIVTFVSQVPTSIVTATIKIIIHNNLKDANSVQTVFNVLEGMMI
jgi:hypothetical protein